MSPRWLSSSESESVSSSSSSIPTILELRLLHVNAIVVGDPNINKCQFVGLYKLSIFLEYFEIIFLSQNSFINSADYKIVI